MSEHRTTDDRGSLVVTRVDARTSLFVVVGHLSPLLARALLDEGERIAAQGDALAFHDWWSMTGYDSEARRMCTDWMLARRTRFRAVHILVASPLVAMGVNVANLALRGFLHATSDRRAFDAAFTSARAAEPASP